MCTDYCGGFGGDLDFFVVFCMFVCFDCGGLFGFFCFIDLGFFSVFLFLLFFPRDFQSRGFLVISIPAFFPLYRTHCISVVADPCLTA